MSLRQDIIAVREEKAKLPFTLESYRLFANHKDRQYKLVLLYVQIDPTSGYERSTRAVIKTYVTHKEVIKAALTAPKQLTEGDQDNV